MQQNTEIFETIPVPKALAKMAVPTIISQLIVMIYNLADTVFIGMTNDPYKIAASSLSFVLFFVMNALSNLFGVGGSSLMSRLLGAKRPDEARRVCAFSFYGAVVLVGAYSLLCLIFSDPLLRMLGASDNTIGFASAYLFWVVIVGGIPASLSMTMGHLLRSEGYAQKASFGLGMGGVINLLLDPLFMFVLLEPGNEVTGAAIATMLSNIISLIYFLIVFFRLREGTILTISPKLGIPERESIVQIFSVGFPSALASLLSCLSNSLMNKLTSLHGDIPLAAMGIVQKIDMLPMNVGMGLCQGMMPLVAYNYASGNHKRMRLFASTARFAGMAFAGLCIVVFELFAGGIVRMLIDDAETIRYGTDFLRICCLATPLMICNFQFNYLFQALGKGRQALFLSTCRKGLFSIPIMLILNLIFGLYGIPWSNILADGITLVVSFWMYSRILKTLEPPKPNAEAN